MLDDPADLDGWDDHDPRDLTLDELDHTARHWANYHNRTDPRLPIRLTDAQRADLLAALHTILAGCPWCASTRIHGLAERVQALQADPHQLDRLQAELRLADHHDRRLQRHWQHTLGTEGDAA